MLINDHSTFLTLRDDPDEVVAQGALQAFARIVDGCADADDLAAFRAWAAYLRLTGSSEDDVASTVAVADHLAAQLGVA